MSEATTALEAGWRALSAYFTRLATWEGKSYQFQEKENAIGSVNLMAAALASNNTDDLTIEILASDFTSTIPKAGQVMTIDGNAYIVNGARYQIGRQFVEISLSK